MLGALTRTARHRRIVVKACVSSQRDRSELLIDVFGEADEIDRIDGIDDFIGRFYCRQSVP